MNLTGISVEFYHFLTTFLMFYQPFGVNRHGTSMFSLKGLVHLLGVVPLYGQTRY